MQFLRGLFGSKPPAKPLLLTGNKDLVSAYEALRKGVTTPAQKLLASPDPSTRYFYAFELGSVVNRELVEAWTTSQPDCWEALLLRAAQGPQWAWEARSNQVASQVGGDQRQEFARRLALVSDDLYTLEQQAPQDPNPHALMLIVAKGENRSKEECAAIWHRLFALDPTHYAGNRNYLDSLLCKWGGTYEGSLEFCRKVIESSPEGSLSGVLHLVALTEQWLYLEAFQKNREQAAQFLRDPSNHQSAQAAYAHSLGSPRFQEAVSSVNACNEAAFWFYLSQQTQPLRQELKKLGDRYTSGPWDYLGDPGVVFQKAAKS